MQYRHWLLSLWCIFGATLVVPKVAADVGVRVETGADTVRHESGRKIYNYRCYYCHGYSGDARTLAASFMNPKPRNFASTPLSSLSHEAMVKVVTEGRASTAMTGFTIYLKPDDIDLVVDFIRKEFMQNQRLNTFYHTRENGWPDHDRYQVAYPFATGVIPLDVDQTSLTSEQRTGLQLFMTSCVSCHDRASVSDEGAIWQTQSVSYPRNNFSYSEISIESLDGTTSASVFAQHDRVRKVSGLTDEEAKGEKLFQDNCAFCHGADGTGDNWIGAFLESRPRDLTNKAYMSAINREYLGEVIRTGLPNTSMPAWRDVLDEPQISALIAYISRVLSPVVLPKRTTEVHKSSEGSRDGNTLH
ncbi:MAG: c-type cytochrome [Porticoccus sp.]